LKRREKGCRDYHGKNNIKFAVACSSGKETRDFEKRNDEYGEKIGRQ
jgi:hypothetical protein